MITNIGNMVGYKIKVVGDHLTKEEHKTVLNDVENIALEVYLEGQWTKVGVH